MEKKEHGSLLLILFLFVSMNATAFSSVFTPRYQIDLNLNGIPLEKVLDILSEQSGVKIAFSNEDLDVQKRVTVHLRTEDIEEALKAVLGDEYTFRQIDDYIAIAKRGPVNTKALPDPVNEQIVTGLVTDVDGNPVIGCTVLIQGTTTGVITDIDGRYSIRAPRGVTLEFRYIGSVTETRTVNSDRVNVRLLEQTVGLEDIVVIGYGQQKKESVVASINSITSKELSSTPTRSLNNAIAGQIAGIIAIQRSGEPGNDDSEFWIRGVSTFSGSTSPLVLVDGVPRAMKDITVDEIETFTVLKDAAATAVYGAEGANGVILITSKRGVTQKPTFDVRAEYSVSKPTRMPSYLQSYDYLSLYNEAVWEDLGNPTSNWVKPYSDEILEMYRTGADPDLYPSADFLQLLKENTSNKRITMNLRGGGERVRYFVSGSFYTEDGIFDSKAIEQYDANIGLSRYNIRSNIDIDVTKTTELSVNISGQYLDQHSPGTEMKKIYEHLFYFAPNLYPLIFSDGTFSDYPEANDTSNPYNLLNETGYTKQWGASIQSTMILKQKLEFITKGLNIRLLGSFDSQYTSSTKRTKKPTTYYMTLNEEGEKEYTLINEGSPTLSEHGSPSVKGEKQVYLEASLNYDRNFNNLHDVTGLVLYMQKERQVLGEGLPYKKQSVVARGTYAYDNRYMLEGSFGMTGSENFAKGNRWGIFPAVGVAWYISNESFLRDAEDILSKLKLRFSYGVTGNDDVGKTRFPYRGTLNQGVTNYPFGFVGGAGGGLANYSSGKDKGITESTYEAPFLSWEIEDKKNLGIDLGLFRGRVDLMLDVFKNDRRNILMQRKTVAGSIGLNSNPYQNYGKMSNKGLDGSLVVKQNIGRVNLTFRGNVTYAKNKLVEYDEAPQPYDYMTYTGNSYNKPKLYIAEGLYKEEDFNVTVDPSNGAKTYELKDGLPVPAGNVKPGDLKYKDLNDDGVIDDYDMTYDHQFYAQNPELIYGFGLNVEYKGFYAGIFFQGAGNTSINVKTGAFVPFQGGLTRSVRAEGLSHWSSNDPDNHDVIFPRLHPDNFSHNQFSSTWWYRSANFLRLKNLEFGYSFDKKLLRNTGIKNARIYVQGTNLAVWDKLKMWDPELGQEDAKTPYPIYRTWTMGLEIGF